MDSKQKVPQGMRESTPVERILDLHASASSVKQESPGFSRGECQRITMEPSRWRRHDIVSFARGLAGTEWDPRFEMFSGGELFHLFLERDVSTGRLMYSMCRDRVLYVIRERPSLREALDLEIDRRMAEIRGVRWVDPTKRKRDEEGLGAFCGPLVAS